MLGIKKVSIISFFILCLTFICILFSPPANTNSTGAPPAKTGSPADVSNCSDCHASFPQTIQGILTSNIPSSGYIPGNIYTITVSLTNSGFSGINKYGFQVSPQDSLGNALGTLIITDIAQTKIVGNGNYITHTMNGNLPDSVGFKTWKFNWQAPIAGTDSVTFYGSFLLANGNGVNTGDQGLLSVLKVAENTTGIKEIINKLNLNIFPNPTQSVFEIKTPKEIYTQSFSLIIYNVLGEKVLYKQYNNADKLEVNTENWGKGIYTVTLNSFDKDYTAKLIVQ